MSSTDFRERVIAIVCAIPKGETTSYGAVARAAGSPRAARAVGAIMRANKDRTVPCHRVIRANGSLGGYNGLREKTKAELLDQESLS